jgi:hypothetical protein
MTDHQEELPSPRTARRKFERYSSFPPPTTVANEIDDNEASNDEQKIAEEVEQVEKNFAKAELKEAPRRPSLTYNDLAEAVYSIPLKEGGENSFSMRRFRRASPPNRRASAPAQRPIHSILRRGSSATKGDAKPLSDKRLSFALSPTFISESSKGNKTWNDSLADNSLHSLSDDDEFTSDESQKAEESIHFGENTTDSGRRRSGIVEMKAKSTLGFDQKFVGFNESDLGSLSASFSSV